LKSLARRRRVQDDGGRVSKIHLDNDSRHFPSSSGNLGGLEDAEEIALDAAAGIPKTHAVGSTPRIWNNRYLGLAFFKLTHYPRKRMFPSQWKML
jgi:hypothetical protein